MLPRDAALAVAVATVWGVAFVATEFALQSFTPPQLTAIRFILAALPILFVRKPDIAWPTLIVLGSFLFLGQFMLQFFAFETGLPPGVASVAIHTQALFTVVIAALVLREIPTRRQIIGLGVAAGGLICVGASVGGDLTALGLMLAIAAAISWGIGNVMLKRVGKVDLLSLMIWMSVVPPLPALAFGWATGEQPGVFEAIGDASSISILAVIYLGIISTTVAYAIWARLLAAYPAAKVAPFALLAPCTGILASYLVFGETFGPLRGAGMVLVVIGIALSVLGGRAKQAREIA